MFVYEKHEKKAEASGKGLKKPPKVSQGRFV